MRAVIAIAIAVMPFVSAHAKEWLAAFLAEKRAAIPLAKLRADIVECEADIAAFQSRIVDRILSAPVADN